ncbi:mavicyanin-like [Vicia villosa]|uniref:mavicyanin-like n=1 Tax=Vicia villosa TaxID=3911 RepID=UPI00273AE246|nr:mavicyanin-like [Vicia villosa]
MKMGGGTILGVVVVVALAAMSMTMDVEAVGEVDHVVGGDHGWDPTSDILYWSSDRIFRVGDQIWFTYSAAQGLIAELKSKEEYESCNMSNPIMMYTEGLHTVPLDKEGMRYFVSTDSQNCKNGLKLHVEVQPKESGSRALPVAQTVVADGPAAPSGSARYGYNVILSVLLCGVVVLAY